LFDTWSVLDGQGFPQARRVLAAILTPHPRYVVGVFIVTKEIVYQAKQNTHTPCAHSMCLPQVTGSPTEDQLGFVTSDKARRYLRSLPYQQRVPYQQLWPRLNPQVCRQGRQGAMPVAGQQHVYTSCHSLLGHTWCKTYLLTALVDSVSSGCMPGARALATRNLPHQGSGSRTGRCTKHDCGAVVPLALFAPVHLLTNCRTLRHAA
jgi:hypothetical protein